MGKISKIIIGTLLIAAALLITFRAIDLEPTKGLPVERQVMAIMQNSGCIKCHDNIKIVLDSIKTGGAIDSYILPKIESVIKDGSMPPFSFTILRPGSSVNSREEEILLTWIDSVRQKSL